MQEVVESTTEVEESPTEAEESTTSAEVEESQPWMLVEMSNLRDMSLRTCFRCDKEESTMKKCGACKAIYYCSRSCQRMHWYESHRESCTRKFMLRWYNAEVSAIDVGGVPHRN